MKKNTWEISISNLIHFFFYLENKTRVDDEEKKEENTDPSQRNTSKSKEEPESEDVSFDDILLWALYANRPQIAELVWLNGKNQLSLYFIYDTL